MCDICLIQFCQNLIIKTEESQLINYWPSLSAYLKEAYINPTMFSNHLIFLPILKLLDTYFRVVSLETRKSWKDTDEIYLGVVDKCINIGSIVFAKANVVPLRVVENLAASSHDYQKFGLESPVQWNEAPSEHELCFQVYFDFFNSHLDVGVL